MEPVPDPSDSLRGISPGGTPGRGHCALRASNDLSLIVLSYVRTPDVIHVTLWRTTYPPLGAAWMPVPACRPSSRRRQCPRPRAKRASEGRLASASDQASTAHRARRRLPVARVARAWRVLLRLLLPPRAPRERRGFARPSLRSSRQYRRRLVRVGIRVRGRGRSRVRVRVRPKDRVRVRVS